MYLLMVYQKFRKTDTISNQVLLVTVSTRMLYYVQSTRNYYKQNFNTRSTETVTPNALLFNSYLLV